MLKKKSKDARAETEQVLVDAKRLEAVENKLARVVGTLTFLQHQRYQQNQPNVASPPRYSLFARCTRNEYQCECLAAMGGRLWRVYLMLIWHLRFFWPRQTCRKTYCIG
jgi:hypothetical protein